MASALHWVAVNPQNGILLDDLQDVIIDQPLKQVISTYSTAQVSLPIASAPEDWLRLTRPYAAALIALDPSTGTSSPQPVWGGIVQQRTRRATGSTITLPLATAEAYFMRRFIRDRLQYPAYAYGVCEVAADLAARYIMDGADGLPGLPLRVDLLDAGGGRDSEWDDPDDKSVFSAYGDLGLEWTVTWEWQHNPERLTPVLTLGSRLGQPLVTPAPKVTFDFPGNLQDAEEVSDYTDGRGANDVMATSTGIGSARPQSGHQLADVFAGRPTLEYRYSAGTSIMSLADLDADAAGEVDAIANGTVSWKLTALYGKGPVFGVEWNLGDDVGYQLRGPQFPDEPEGIVRPIGVEFAAKAYSPILAGQE